MLKLFFIRVSFWMVQYGTNMSCNKLGLFLKINNHISLFRHQCYKWRMSSNIWNMAVDQWESLCCHHLSGIVYNSVPVPHWDSSPCFMAPYWRSEKNLSSARLPLCSVNQPTSGEFSCLLCCIVFINELAWSWWCCTVIWFDMQAHW